MQESAYQAALGATQRVIQPSLVDFMSEPVVTLCGDILDPSDRPDTQ